MCSSDLMFEKLDQSSRLNDGGQYPYLRSHPLTSERITEARLRAAGLPPPQGPGDVLHALMQARARVMADGGEVALRRLQAQLNRSANGATVYADAFSMARWHATQLAADLRTAQAKPGLSVETKAHLAETLEMLNGMLKATMTRT